MSRTSPRAPLPRWRRHAFGFQLAVGAGALVTLTVAFMLVPLVIGVRGSCARRIASG